MGETVPIDLEKFIIAPIDFDKKPHSIHRFGQFSCENGGYKETLHYPLRFPKEGPAYQKYF